MEMLVAGKAWGLPDSNFPYKWEKGLEIVYFPYWLGHREDICGASPLSQH